ncbi:MAG: class IV adenylate cyclase [Elusimicrobia bacterium]|nr:class IV adenylate cyclase [Elusimicrobiota bacterium]
MARNVEIKARAGDLSALAARAAALGGRGPAPIEQEDVFFRCLGGRLKLRVFPDGSGELISYRRPDASGPKTSDYRRVAVADPGALRAVLADALGEAGRVRKRRSLYLLGRTRVHLDEVEGLGAFLELEVVLADGEDAAAGEAEALALMADLGVSPSDLVEGAYVDLLAGAACR